MSPHAYTEDQLLEQPAIGLFGALGWATESALDESFGAGGASSLKDPIALETRWRRHAMNTLLQPSARASTIPAQTAWYPAGSAEAIGRHEIVPPSPRTAPPGLMGRMMNLSGLHVIILTGRVV